MRKTTETSDDVSMLLGIAQGATGERPSALGCFIAQGHEQADSSMLIHEAFGMFERHVEKASLIHGEIQIRAGFDALPRSRQG